jgi:5'-nucleotidase
MVILLTNDDGIRAPGLVAMYRELTRLGEVQVIAPETVQSAAGHGITISAPLLTSRVSVENGFDGVAVDGSPADCVKLAVSQIMRNPPDLVVSGINSGANVGINVVYSGTIAAAIEAAFLGLPSIAVSLLYVNDIPMDYARAAVLARQTIQQVLAAGLPAGRVVSINLPALREGENPTGVKVVRQCTRPWVDTYERRLDPKGREYFWNSSVFTLSESESDTDVAALRDGYITITPLHFDMTHPLVLKEWNQLDWRLPKL